jgi:Ca2+-binding RTX toxin-like protein
MGGGGWLSDEHPVQAAARIARDIEEAAMYIPGRYFKLYNIYYDDYDDPLPGTTNNDTIDGLGGDDQIWGNLGNDEMYGGTGDDIIMPGTPNNNTTANWGYDTAYGEEGNDTLDFAKTLNDVELHGGPGNDYVIGGNGDDTLKGGTGSDHVYGNNGDDKIYGALDSSNTGWDQGYTNYLFGGAGNDTVYGGTDEDWIFGGDDNDWLYGKSGDDVIFGQGDDDVIFGGGGKDVLCGGDGWDSFVFGIGESDPQNPDTITDFDCTQNFIDLSQAGTSSNYEEHSIGYNAGYQAAFNSAVGQFNGTIRNVFVTDGVNGYLFIDSNGDLLAENGIVLEDLNGLSDFAYGNISNIV